MINSTSTTVTLARLESLERGAVAKKNIKKYTADDRAYLLNKIFGKQTEIISTPKPTEQVIQENKKKYSLIADRFCTIYTTNDILHGRFSKLENKSTKEIDDSSTINFYSTKYNEYLDVNLAEVNRIKAKGFDEKF